MAFQRVGLSSEVQVWLRSAAAEVRLKLSGPEGCPEWGAKFREIEAAGMYVGLDLARLVMEQSVSVPLDRVPDAALRIAGDEVSPTGRETVPWEAEFGTRPDD